MRLTLLAAAEFAAVSVPRMALFPAPVSTLSNMPLPPSCSVSLLSCSFQNEVAPELSGGGMPDFMKTKWLMSFSQLPLSTRPNCALPVPSDIASAEPESTRHTPLPLSLRDERDA